MDLHDIFISLYLDFSIDDSMYSYTIILELFMDTLLFVLPTGGRVLLFGSQARGVAREDSDWDILILIDKERINNDDFDNVAYPLMELGWKIGAMINPLLYTYSDWQKRNFTPFYKNVEQESIEICR